MTTGGKRDVIGILAGVADQRPNKTVQNFFSLGSPTRAVLSSARPSAGSSWCRAAARNV